MTSLRWTLLLQSAPRLPSPLAEADPVMIPILGAITFSMVGDDKAVAGAVKDKVAVAIPGARSVGHTVTLPFIALNGIVTA